MDAGAQPARADPQASPTQSLVRAQLQRVPQSAAQVALQLGAQALIGMVQGLIYPPDANHQGAASHKAESQQAPAGPSG